MRGRDPFLDHVLAIAGLDPYALSGAEAVDPLVQAANLRAAQVAQQYAPALPVPAVVAPPLVFQQPAGAGGATTTCYGWPILLLAGAAGGLLGFALGSRR